MTDEEVVIEAVRKVAIKHGYGGWIPDEIYKEIAKAVLEAQDDAEPKD